MHTVYSYFNEKMLRYSGDKQFTKPQNNYLGMSRVVRKINYSPMRSAYILNNCNFPSEQKLMFQDLL